MCEFEIVESVGTIQMLLFDNPEIQEGASFTAKVVAGAELNGVAVFGDRPLEMDVPIIISQRVMEMAANKDELDAEKFLDEQFSLGYEPFDPRSGDYVEADINIEGSFLGHQLEIGYFIPPPDVPETILAVKFMNNFPKAVLDLGM